MTRRPNCSCSVCGKKVYRRPFQLRTGRVYCSVACCGIDRRILKDCPICKRKYLGLKRACSRACANQTRKGILYTGENRSNLAHLGKALKKNLARRRGGICEKCHERNYAILQVHHKIERANGGTDEVSNLELLCPNCHMAHHLGFRLFKG